MRRRVVTAESIVKAIRDRGSDTNDLRDGAHEAYHAMETKLQDGFWDRNSISYAVKGLGRSGAARSEIMARAVEQIVCARMKVPTKPVDYWAMISSMEAAKFREPFMTPSQAADGIKRAMRTHEALDAAIAIIKLGVQL